MCLAFNEKSFGTVLTTLPGKNGGCRTRVNSAGSATLVSLTLNIKDLTRGHEQPCAENSEVKGLILITIATEGLVF